MFPLFDENRVSLWLSFPPYYGEFLIVKIMSENEREIKWNVKRIQKLLFPEY